MKSGTRTNKGVCNSRNYGNCPLDAKCLAEYIIYKVAMSIPYLANILFSSAEGNFKSMYNNHAKLIRSRR